MSNNEWRMRGTVKAIAHRAVDSDPMIEADSVNVLPGRGIDSENRKAGEREITLLSVQSWADACKELGQEIPWWIRRANLLIDGVPLGDTIGRHIRVGPVEIQVHGETKPCKIMHGQVPGLTRALAKECRGGVYGEVLVGGVIRVGDEVRVLNGAK